MHDAFCNLGNIYALGLGMEQGGTWIAC
jgi:hypothetical protein